MKRSATIRFGASLLVIFGLIGSLGSMALAEGPPTVCDTPLTPTTPLSGTFGSLVVPAGKNCDIANAVVYGNIVVNEGSTLSLLGGVFVTGNLSASNSYSIGAFIMAPFGTTPNTVGGNISTIGTTGDPNGVAVEFCGTVVGGNVRIANTQYSVAFGGSESGAACTGIGGGNHVPDGNVSIEKSGGLFFRAADNVVGGDFRIVGNTGGATKRVLNNVVGRTLTCTDNDSPFVIGGNVASKLIGQCGP
jgi:hypothetical protein